MRHLAALLLLSLICLPAFSKKPKDEILLSFAGPIKRITKKEIVIESTPDNEMTFVRTRKTTFRSGGKAIDGSALPAGIVVTVQAFEKMNAEVEAVSVTVSVPDQLPDK